MFFGMNQYRPYNEYMKAQLPLNHGETTLKKGR